MHIAIVCKVIDNYGDAGFALRLGRALATIGHDLVLFHDHAPTFKALYPRSSTNRLKLVDASATNQLPPPESPFDLILEPFGTSSEQTLNRFDLNLKQSYPTTPWLLIDYISAEKWVEGFHLSSSIDPRTGHVFTFFYPGFTAKTGGLIHCDLSRQHEEPDQPQHTMQSGSMKLFVFCYSNAPLIELLDWCQQTNDSKGGVDVGLAGPLATKRVFKGVTALPFCPQDEFDDLLNAYDVLFVRGEDSFVRAQLAGKPIVWQIYATPDEAHAKKLASFFNIYAADLSSECASALWDCWSSWNRLENCPVFADSWAELQNHWFELATHAKKWRNALFNGPELVKEVLTWRSRQTPTLIEKIDL